jgi:hypothetical protein
MEESQVILVNAEAMQAEPYYLRHSHLAGIRVAKEFVQVVLLCGKS